MGCKQSSVDDKAAKQRSKGIDTILKKDKRLFEKECKLLLLGKLDWFQTNAKILIN